MKIVRTQGGTSYYMYVVGKKNPIAEILNLAKYSYSDIINILPAVSLCTDYRVVSMKITAFEADFYSPIDIYRAIIFPRTLAQFMEVRV